MGEEVKRALGNQINKGTTKYLPCVDWENRLIKENERPAPGESLSYDDYPRFLYDPKDRPIYSN